MGRYQVHRNDTTQHVLVEWLESRGCLYEHLGQPVDGLLCVPVRGGYLSVPVEFKSRYGALRPSQEAFLAKWKAPTYVLKTETQCAAMLAELGAVRG